MQSLVPYVSNIDRMQEECDVLALTLARYDKVALYANLRPRCSLLCDPCCRRDETWSENAWMWFWGYVEKKVDANKQFSPPRTTSVCAPSSRWTTTPWECSS
ncbi:unnamed protein product [Symbiodinium sp. CCMP2456]|nr:unnamed protein product [Symbiodinium sp. CCMP2456]